MEIIKQLSAVMADVGAVRKTEKNSAQGFNFRGIDAVTNAVFPAMVKHGVVVVPTVVASSYDTVTVGRNATQMGHARVTVEYQFFAGDGSTISATVCAESMDSGDKATAKAMSVAFRTALLQALCLPTDEIDPDHDVYERSSAPAKPAAKSKGKAENGAAIDPKGADVDPSVPLTEEQLNQFNGACTKADVSPITVYKKAGVQFGSATRGDLPKLREAFKQIVAEMKAAGEQTEG